MKKIIFRKEADRNFNKLYSLIAKGNVIEKKDYVKDDSGSCMNIYTFDKIH